VRPRYLKGLTTGRGSPAREDQRWRRVGARRESREHKDGTLQGLNGMPKAHKCSMCHVRMPDWAPPGCETAGNVIAWKEQGDEEAP